MPRTFWIYILASHGRRLYVGVTNDLQRRVHEHRTARNGFTARYRIDRLVWFESTPNVRAAIEREKEIKSWRREKKIRLIEEANRGWIDLAAAVIPKERSD